MGSANIASKFKSDFIARVKAAREARFTQAEIADLLQIPQDRYKQYETRSILPHFLIPKFCTACGISVEYLFTAMPVKQPSRTARKLGIRKQIGTRMSGTH